MERVDGNVIYLKDGTIYGAIYSNGETSQYPDINGEKIVSKGAFNYSSVTVTKSGKVYIVSGYDGDMNTYVYTLDENEKVLINRDGNIYTTKNRLLEIKEVRNPSTGEYEAQVTETDMTGILPKAQIPQVARILFGSAEVTDFEILDNFTIRARVPANARGMYGISFQSVGSSAPALMGLSYEYITSSGENNGDSGGSSTIISAPNTGFSRN